MLPIKVEAVPAARGVTVYTGDTAEHYGSADDYHLDDKGNLWVTDISGRNVALFYIGTAIRVEVGPYNPDTAPPF